MNLWKADGHVSYTVVFLKLFGEYQKIFSTVFLVSTTGFHGFCSRWANSNDFLFLAIHKKKKNWSEKSLC